MSTGCAIVSSDVEAVSEMAGGENPTLLQVDHRNPGAVAAAIKSLLSDREKAKALGAAARDLILKNYAAKDIYARKEAWLRAARDETKSAC
jgi:glycosyltransferase involved in cell wall biosynthesis